MATTSSACRTTSASGYDAMGRAAAAARSAAQPHGRGIYPPPRGRGALRARRDRPPVLVTEHGVGTDDDTVRASFIPAALAGLKTAMDDGVPVLGYCHWSLLDNFEWIFGYGPKFGLFAVDRQTFPTHGEAQCGRLWCDRATQRALKRGM